MGRHVKGDHTDLGHGSAGIQESLLGGRAHGQDIVGGGEGGEAVVGSRVGD